MLVRHLDRSCWWWRWWWRRTIWRRHGSKISRVNSNLIRYLFFKFSNSYKNPYWEKRHSLVVNDKIAKGEMASERVNRRKLKVAKNYTIRMAYATKYSVKEFLVRVRRTGLSWIITKNTIPGSHLFLWLCQSEINVLRSSVLRGDEEGREGDKTSEQGGDIKYNVNLHLLKPSEQ